MFALLVLDVNSTVFLFVFGLLFVSVAHEQLKERALLGLSGPGAGGEYFQLMSHRGPYSELLLPGPNVGSLSEYGSHTEGQSCSHTSHVFSHIECHMITHTEGHVITHDHNQKVISEML